MYVSEPGLGFEMVSELFIARDRTFRPVRKRSEALGARRRS